MSKESTRVDRAEFLSGRLELLTEFRRRMVKLAPLAGSDAVVYADMLRDYMQAELATLERPTDKTHARRVAWAVLYAMHEHASSTSPSPKAFAEAAGMTTNTLLRCRRAAPPLVRKVYGLSDAEHRINFELFADNLGLVGTRRAAIERLALGMPKRPARKVP